LFLEISLGERSKENVSIKKEETKKIKYETKINPVPHLVARIVEEREKNDYIVRAKINSNFKIKGREIICNKNIFLLHDSLQEERTPKPDVWLE